MIKILLVILALTTMTTGFGECNKGGGNNDQSSPFADFLVREINDNGSSKFYAINNKGEILREIAENITDKDGFTPISKTKALVKTYNNKLYLSTDGWKTFKEIFTWQKKDGGTLFSIDHYYAGNGMMSVTAKYTDNSTDELLSEFYESYDNGANWRTLQVDENISSSYLSRTGGSPDSFGAHNLKTVIRTTYNSNTNIVQYDIINNKGGVIRQIAKNIPNQGDLRIMDDKTAYLIADKQLYRSDDGYIEFAPIFTFPDVSDYTFDFASLSKLTKDMWFYATYIKNNASRDAIIHDYIMDSNNPIRRKVTNPAKEGIIPAMDGAVIFGAWQDNLSISTDKGITFTPFFTPEVIKGYTISYIDPSYGLQGVAKVTVTYINDNDDVLNRYYETYDNGKTWKLFENISGATISRPYFIE